MGLLPPWRLYVSLLFSSFSLAHKIHYEYTQTIATCYAKWYSTYYIVYIACMCIYMSLHTCVYIYTWTHISSTLQLIFFFMVFPQTRREPHYSVSPTVFLNAQAVWAQADEEWEHSRETSSWMRTGFEHEGKKRSSFDVMDSAPRKLWIGANWWSKTLILIEKALALIFFNWNHQLNRD